MYGLFSLCFHLGSVYTNSDMRPAILFSLKTMESLQNGVATHFRVTLLFSMRTVSLASSGSCGSVDSDARCKQALNQPLHPDTARRNLKLDGPVKVVLFEELCYNSILSHTESLHFMIVFWKRWSRNIVFVRNIVFASYNAIVNKVMNKLRIFQTVCI